MSEPIPGPVSVTEGDSWDLFRADSADWDPDIKTVGQLLNVLGAGGHTEAQQREALGEYVKTAPYQACPDSLKQQIQQFLEAS